MPTNMATDTKGVDAYPSAGPYYIASVTSAGTSRVKKNTNYKGTRPANVDTFDIYVNTNLDQSLLQVKAGQVDYDMGGLPPTAHADSAQQYGVNKSQYFVNPLVETDYVALNTAGTRSSASTMRKAANFAIDRPAMLRVRGAYAGKRTDQILPPGMGGFRDAKIYPIAGRRTTRRRRRSPARTASTVNLWTATSARRQALGQVFKYNLAADRLQRGREAFQGFQIYTAAGTKGADFDAAVVGWNQDYPDPYDFLDVLLNGNNIHDNNNNNLAYFNNASIN